MMNSLPESFKPKSFWEKKEGTTGMAFAAIGIVAGGIGLFKLLPFIITLLQNTLYTIFLGGAVAAIGYVLLDPKFRNLLSYGYKSLMRFITGCFVTIDPIGIIKNYISKLQDNLEKIDRQIANVKGQMVSLDRELSTNKQRMDQNFKLVQAAKGDEKYKLATTKALRSSGRIDKFNVTLKELRVKLEVLYRTLSKTREAADFMIGDLTEEVEVKERERKAILAGHSAIKSAMRIISPEQDQKVMFDMAMEYMAEDVSNKIGDIENFLEVSKGFMESVDLQNGVFEQEGWDLLEKWEKEDSAMLGTNKQLLIAQSKDDRQPLDYNNPIQKEKIPRENQFRKMFN